MSEKRPLCRFCGQRHFGCCETDRTVAKSFITEYLADRPHRTAAKSERIHSLSGDEPVPQVGQQTPADVREADGTSVRKCTDRAQVYAEDGQNRAQVYGLAVDDDGVVTGPCPCGCGETIEYRPSWPSSKHRAKANRNRAKRKRTNPTNE